MGTAILYGAAASSALVIGAALGSRYKPSQMITDGLLAFASGALISALSFELFDEAFELGGAARSGLALLAGAGAFVLADTLLDRYTEGRSASGHEMGSGRGGDVVGLALLAGVTLDGVPENLALGVSLVDDASLSLLVAIFFSNLPESLVGAMRMREGTSARRVMGLWGACALLLAAAVVVGNAFGGVLSDEVLSVALGFAGGAVLASLATTLMPEAYTKGHPSVAFATAAGFFLSYVLAV
ncbi:MAG: zinc permease [Actinomycetota bacterium]|nr:zinc permease [Actinomycetota bacterium]